MTMRSVKGAWTVASTTAYVSENTQVNSMAAVTVAAKPTVFDAGTR